MFRSVALLGAGLFAAFGSQAAGIPGAGALGCLITAFSAAIGWRRISVKVDEVRKTHVEIYTNTVCENVKILHRSITSLLQVEFCRIYSVL